MGIAALHNLRGLVLPADPESRQAAFTPGRDFTEQVEESGISAQLDWDLDNGMEFTSITAYRDWDALRDQDVDFSGIDRAYRDDYAVGFENFTQEFRLHGQHGRLDWLLGAFYGSETTNLTDTIRFGADAAAYIDLLAVGAQLAAGVPPGSVTSIYGTAVTPFPAADALFALTAPVPGEGQLDTYEVETTTMALFTHNEISLSDQLTLTVGVRYNQDEKDFSADISNIDLSPLPSSCQALQASLLAGSPPYANILALGPLLPLICSPAVNEQAVGAYNDTSEDNEFNGILSLAYDFTPDLMGYVSYSRGYKAGGYNLDRLGFNYALTGGPPITLPGTPPRQLDSTPDPTVEPSANDLQFDPEFVDAYEVGAKWTTWNGALTLNAAAFYEQITDYQNNAFTGFNFQTFNVPDTVSAGVELEWTARLTDQFTWQGGVLYNDAYIDSTVVLPGETITAGTPLDRAPDWTFTSALTYEQPISDNLVALFYVDGRWEGEQRLQVLGRDPRTDQESYALFNARVGIGPTDQRWSVEAFVDNLADEYYNLGAFAVPEQTSDGVGVYAVYPGQPRTWGVTVRARY